MKNFKKYFFFLSLFVLILNADNSIIYDYEIRFKNKIGPLSFDGLKTFSKQDKGFKVIFKGENKLLNARIIQESEFTFTNSKVFPKNYIQQVKIPIKGKQEQNIAYDYRNMKIISSGDVNWVIDFFNDEIPLDPISMGFQIRQNLKKGNEEFVINLIKLDEGTYKENFFKVIGEEIITIKDTKYPCKVLERTHEKGGKSLYFIGETLDFILVKVTDDRKERKISIKAEKILSFG
tara:strand:- start:520 stop:1221 length:702 start_codon:yes stop_codon:yes gene_type:complete